MQPKILKKKCLTSKPDLEELVLNGQHKEILEHYSVEEVITFGLDCFKKARMALPKVPISSKDIFRVMAINVVIEMLTLLLKLDLSKDQA